MRSATSAEVPASPTDRVSSYRCWRAAKYAALSCVQDGQSPEPRSAQFSMEPQLRQLRYPIGSLATFPQPPENFSRFLARTRVSGMVFACISSKSISVSIACPCEVLHGVPERIGSGVSRPTVCVGYTSKRKPSSKMFCAVLRSLSCTVPQTEQVHFRTARSFVLGHCAPQAELGRTGRSGLL